MGRSIDMKHEIGDQWIEVIDGKEHMVKAIEPTDLCQGCLYNGNGGGCWRSGFDDECEMGSRFIIRDLGILNNYGMLPCPFCGEYPGKRVGNDNWKCGCKIGAIATWQEAIDTWNRRS